MQSCLQYSYIGLPLAGSRSLLCLFHYAHCACVHCLSWKLSSICLLLCHSLHVYYVIRNSDFSLTTFSLNSKHTDVFLHIHLLFGTQGKLSKKASSHITHVNDVVDLHAHYGCESWDSLYKKTFCNILNNDGVHLHAHYGYGLWGYFYQKMFSHIANIQNVHLNAY